MKIYFTFLLAFCLTATTFLHAQTVETVATGLNNPAGLVLDGNTLYVSEYNGGQISKIDLTQPLPAPVTALLTGLQLPTGLSVIDGYLYFGTEVNVPGFNTPAGRIDLSAMNPVIEAIISNSPVGYAPYAFVKNGDDLYISSVSINGGPGGIFKINLAAPLPQNAIPVATGFDATGMALRGNDLYFGFIGGQEVSKIDISQPNPVPVTVISGLAGPFGLTFNGNFLYISEATGASIKRIDVTQPNPVAETVVSGVVTPSLMAFDGTILYFAELSTNKVSRIVINQPILSALTTCDNTSTSLGGASPTGGTYSGPGVTDNGNGETFTFDPVAAGGPGAYTITYTLANDSSATATLTVTAAPVIGFFGFNTDVITPPSPLPDPGSGPAGGVYSGPGVLQGNIFDAALAGVGVHVLTYTFTDANGCTGTGTGNITVNPAPHDDCADAKDINNLFGGPQNVPQTSSLQNNTGYSSNGDPAVSTGCFFNNDPLQHTIWYTFTGDGNTYRIRSVQCNATNYITNGDTQVAIFTGDCNNPTQVACNDDESGSSLNISVDIATQAGQTYRMLVDGYGGLQGEFCLEVTNLTQTVISIPALGTVCSNVTAPLGGATPTGGIYSGPGVTDNGNGSTFSFNPTTAGGPGTYTVTYTLPNGSSATATVTVTAAPVIGVFGFLTDVVTPPSPLPDPSAGPAGGIYSGVGVLPGNIFDAALAGAGVHLLTYTFTDANGCTGTGTGTISVNPAPFDGCADANDINNLFGAAFNVPQTSSLQDNTGYSSNGDPAVSTGCFFNDDPVQKSIWYTFTGDGNTYRIRSVQCNATNYITNGDTQVAIFTGDCNNPTQVACNDDESGSSLNISVDIATQAGQTYRMLVDGYLGLQGQFCLEVTNLASSAVTETGQTGIALFPNPTTGVVQLANLSAHQVQVFDNQGRLVMQVTHPGNRLDISAVPAGLYLLKIAEGDRVHVARVVKE